MRRLGLVVTLLCIVSCSKSSTPTTPTPPPSPPPDGTAAAIFLTPNSWDLPPGGGSLEITIATAAHVAGNVAAAHVPVSLRASDGQLSDTESRTDSTGHARVTWTGSRSATITARAGDAEGVAIIRVQSETPNLPPGPGPNPNPNPGPTPNPNPSPGPAPRPTPPGRSPAGDLVATIIPSLVNPDANETVRFTTVLASSNGSAVPAIDEYVWDVNGDRLPDRWEASPTTTYAAAGAYIVELELHTADNRAVNTTLTLQVGPVPALAATMTATPSSAGLGETVALTASATATGNVGSLSYAWDVDGNGSTDTTTATNSTTTTYATIGTKAPKVTVTGSRGGNATATTNVTVTAPALTVGLATSGTQTAPAALTFTATVTAASGSVPSGLSYAWDFDGNGTTDFTGSGTSGGHTYNAPGTYVVKVTVTAPDGRTATNTISVTVN